MVTISRDIVKKNQILISCKACICVTKFMRPTRKKGNNIFVEPLFYSYRILLTGRMIPLLFTKYVCYIPLHYIEEA